MQRLALTFLLASAAAALASISTSPAPVAAAGPAKTLALACCDDPPPCGWPGYPCPDTTKPPDGNR